LYKNSSDPSWENKFDLVIIDINNLNPNDGISPPPVFFDDSVLKTIYVIK
jgi:hypothetical protein